EKEDLGMIASAYSTLTGAGILGLSNAAQLMKLPEDPNAEHIGRTIVTKDGPIFLDDIASSKMRDAAAQAKMAGFQMAANPPDTDGANTGQTGDKDEEDQSNVQENQHKLSTQASKNASSRRDTSSDKEQGKEVDDQSTPQSTKGQSAHNRSVGSADREASTATERVSVAQVGSAGADTEEPFGTLVDRPDIDAKIDYRRWRTRALDDIKAHKPQRGFSTTLIAEPIHRCISTALAWCETADEVRLVFQRVQESAENAGQLDYDPKNDVWEPANTIEQLQAMRDQGTRYLRWDNGVSASGVCPICLQNHGAVVKTGERFPSGHRVPPVHLHCECSVERLKEKPVGVNK
ncbi:MAG TPA: hypothetical protein VH593_23355, partial [Ktedonobacteraceae bacterium]